MSFGPRRLTSILCMLAWIAFHLHCLSFIHEKRVQAQAGRRQPLLLQGAMRDVASAPAVRELSQDELREAQDAAEFLAWNREDQQVYRVQWLARSRLTTHGLTGFAKVWNRDASVLKSERTRVHLCRKADCGMKFDPRLEPVLIHGVPVEWPPELLGDDPIASQAGAGDVPGEIDPHSLRSCEGSLLDASSTGPALGVTAPAVMEAPAEAEDAAPAGIPTHSLRSCEVFMPEPSSSSRTPGIQAKGKQAPSLSIGNAEEALPEHLPSRQSPARGGSHQDAVCDGAPTTPGDCSLSELEPTSEVDSDFETVAAYGSSLDPKVWHKDLGQSRDAASRSSRCDPDLRSGEAAANWGSCEQRQDEAGNGEGDSAEELERYRLPALRLLLEEEALKWERTGYYLPLMAFMLLCNNTGRRLILLAGESEVDVFLTLAPSISPGDQPLAVDEDPDFRSGEVMYVIACKVERDHSEMGRVLMWPDDERDFLKLNHYVSCIKSELASEFEPHAPCGGLWCGGSTEPCMGPLFSVCGRSGLLPMPTACNGECAPDICCFSEGLPRDSAHWRAMRAELSSLLMEVVQDTRWVDVFDQTLQPDWQPLARILLNQSKPQKPIAGAGSGPAKSSEPSLCSSKAEPSMASGPSLCSSKDGAPPAEQPPKAASCPEIQSSGCSNESLRQAIRWAACGEDDVELMMDGVVNHIIEKLPMEQLDMWLRRHKEEKEKEEIMNAGKGKGQGDKLELAQLSLLRGDSAIAKVSKPRGRKNRSYLVSDTIKLANEYRAEHRKEDGKRRERGSIKRFLRTKPVSQDKIYYDHFCRVLSKLSQPGAFALARRRKQLAVPEAKRRRFHGRQGDHSVKAPILREELFRWFVSMRGLVKGRLPLHVLRTKALSLRMWCIVSALQAGLRPCVPKILGTNWLWRFRLEYRISLRSPNKRWKVPRAVLLQRLRIMWLNIIRIRCLCLLIHGYDMEAAILKDLP